MSEKIDITHSVELPSRIDKAVRVGIISLDDLELYRALANKAEAEKLWDSTINKVIERRERSNESA